MVKMMQGQAGLDAFSLIHLFFSTSSNPQNPPEIGSKFDCSVVPIYFVIGWKQVFFGVPPKTSVFLAPSQHFAICRCWHEAIKNAMVLPNCIAEAWQSKKTRKRWEVSNLNHFLAVSGFFVLVVLIGIFSWRILICPICCVINLYMYINIYIQQFWCR